MALHGKNRLFSNWGFRVFFLALICTIHLSPKFVFQFPLAGVFVPLVHLVSPAAF